MARVHRYMPPDHRATSREHSLGGTVVTFNAEDEAEVDDPDALEVIAQFPEVFALVGAAPVVPAAAPSAPVPAVPGAFTEADLDLLTMADLHDIALGMNIPGVRNMRKADLIEAILTQQTIVGDKT